MPTRHMDDFAEIVREPTLASDETTSERFDRMAFASRAIAMVRAPKTRVALCEGRSRVELFAGRAWGEDADAQWAILRVPPTASRRAIALAALGLASNHARAPYALEILLSELATPKDA